MSMTRANMFKIENKGGMSITNRLNPMPYTDKEKGDIILKNLNKKGIEILEDEKLCICGSGKFIENCHKSVEKNSLVYLLWEKYLTFDTEVQRQINENNVNLYCKKNKCNKCCKEYFYVSSIEYFLIKNHILETKGENYLKNIISKSKYILEKLEKSYNDEFLKLNKKNVGYQDMFNDKEYLSRFVECPLLGEDGLCECYEARPFICRFFGTSHLYLLCDEIITYFNKRNKFFYMLNKYFKFNFKIPTKLLNKNMVEIAFTEEQQENVEIIAVGENNSIVQRPYPLFYFFANDKIFKENYILSTTLTPKEYAQRQIK